MTFHPEHTPPTPGQLRDRLAKAGLRATRQRLTILECLLQLPGHPTAEQVHRQVLQQVPNLSLGTVYKALDSFVEAGLTRRVASAEGASRRYDADCSAHHHLICSDTQEILDFHDPQLDALLQEFFAQRNMPGFQAHTFSLHITGEKVAR
ncbi:Fur family transcriptional regulator [Hymenobacter yonginensis]|uniref:Fur family transcriptional regulator n=1 Tax=Hymenobacter yonginensis TaxID=748197 RepID=A0ABY7PTC9_9BACT|nr:Fur family transcriptional regulator [Hymenobacter yonginensis]WBO85804.1 Fur family transcriptional regulator [Hymenobacter yonginensis]